MAFILVLNGPNLNLLGSREPAVYGTVSLDQIHQKLITLGVDAKHRVECLQSNSEHVLIERIHQAGQESVAFIIFNPAAFSHTSIALRDALLAVNIPFIEVHLSNIYQREPFRHHSYFSDIAAGVIIGLGVLGYEIALRAVIHKLQFPKTN